MNNVTVPSVSGVRTADWCCSDNLFGSYADFSWLAVPVYPVVPPPSCSLLCSSHEKPSSAHTTSLHSTTVCIQFEFLHIIRQEEMTQKDTAVHCLHFYISSYQMTALSSVSSVCLISPCKGSFNLPRQMSGLLHEMGDRGSLFAFLGSL